MTKLRTNGGGEPHAAAARLGNRLARGEIDRRAFLRAASWLGVSAASARAFAGSILGAGSVLGAQAASAAETPKRGGSLRFACQIQEMADPSAVSWVESSNVFRNSLEFLTLVDADDVTHPYLAESWQPSEDLKTWRFTLRRGVKWSNGDDFTSEDVAATFRHWLAPDSASSNKTSFASVTDVEVTGPHTFTLHLSRPMAPLPEMLYAYTCPVLHRRFAEEGGDWSKNPIGTGPYTMTEFAVGQAATFQRRDGYWGEEPYLDEIRYIDLGTDPSAQIGALVGQQVDALYRITVAELDLVGRLPNVQLLSNRSARTLCLRMQVDQKPFDDVRVRRAVQLCADNQRMLDLAFRGRGLIAEDHHVAPFQEGYAKLPPVQRDVAQAKRLLAEAGHEGGLDLTLLVGNTQGRWEQDTAQVLQQNCAEAGINLQLNVLPSSEYWSIWNKVPFGLTYWAHRPLPAMTLDLAYRSGAAWNESHFADPAFDAALDRAMAVVDPAEATEAMGEVQTILRDSGVIVQPYWADLFTVVGANVRGFRVHPAEYFNFHRTWLA